MPNLEPTPLETIERLCGEADIAFQTYRKVSASERAAFLEAIASGLEKDREELTKVAGEESHLPPARLNGELDRTTGQLRMFAKDLRDGKLDVEEVTEAMPDRQPLPRPQIVRSMVAIGPVAVFGASNFPFAFSVAGGDTASALAAGCTVVCKSNPAHPYLSKLISEVIKEAVKQSDLPSSVFTLIHGGAKEGAALVENRAIKAVGFTGSLHAGRAIMDLAAKRENPIQVYAEMGSVNPVIVLPGALRDRGDAIADGYATSLTMGVGQFCTNPGVVIGTKGEEWTNFLTRVQTNLKAQSSGTMLTEGIGAAYVAGVQEMAGIEDVEVLVDATAPGQPAFYHLNTNAIIGIVDLGKEVFGPFGLAVTAPESEDLATYLAMFPGQLTITIHYGSGDEALVKEVASQAEQIAGRIVFNGFPTGVEVCQTMHHGGPYPASSDSRHTSVGNHAVDRWLRPVSYQNAPDWL